MNADPADLDPFDLPEWLGTAEVTWTNTTMVQKKVSAISGVLRSDGHQDVPCDLLAVDDAYPVPAASEAVRLLSHQAWRHGELYLGTINARLTLLVPGFDFDADRVLEALRRLAKAVGASTDNYSAHLRVGR